MRVAFTSRSHPAGVTHGGSLLPRVTMHGKGWGWAMVRSSEGVFTLGQAVENRSPMCIGELDRPTFGQSLIIKPMSVRGDFTLA